MSTASPPPSGQQWAIRRGVGRPAGPGDDSGSLDELVVVEVGGGIRTWTRAGVAVLAGYDEDAISVAGRGQQLIPWPNRIRDGRYTFGGTTQQLPLSEPRTGNASHGLVRWAAWDLLDRTASSLTVGFRLHPQPGWPGILDLTTLYALADDGLTVTTTVRNVGAAAVPFGYGAHPYVWIGDVPVADVVLDLPAASYLEVDPERLLPVGTHPAEGTPYDFRGGRPIGDTALDTAYTDLTRGVDGRWEVTLHGVPAGAVTVWGDEAYGWTQVFTGRAHPQTEGSTGIAVEPMTCPPDAFNSGTDVVVLAPGQSHTGSWGIRPH